MQCENIVLVAFYHGDGDRELTDNIEALQKKKKAAKVGDAFVNTFTVEIAKGQEGEAAGKILAHKGALMGKDSGLYLIIHSGATTSNPSAEVLAVIVSELYSAGLKFRKINLAGCFSAGNKASTVPRSPLAAFTSYLIKILGKDKDRLKGTSVCGYQMEVTTFDQESKHYQNLVESDRNGGKGFAKPSHTAGVHNLFQVTKEKRLLATHAPVTGAQVASITNFNTRYDKIYDKGPYQKAKTPEEKEKTFLAQMGVVDKQQKIGDQPLADDLQVLVNNYEVYLRNKLVVVYSPDKGTFIPSSLADYTDNATIRSMIVQVEKTKGSAKYMFSL